MHNCPSKSAIHLCFVSWRPGALKGDTQSWQVPNIITDWKPGPALTSLISKAWSRINSGAELKTQPILWWVLYKLHQVNLFCASSSFMQSKTSDLQIGIKKLWLVTWYHLFGENFCIIFAATTCWKVNLLSPSLHQSLILSSCCPAEVV